MQREVVVLPQPLSPTSDSVSPRSMVKLTSSTARTWPTTRPQQAAMDREELPQIAHVEDAGHATAHVMARRCPGLLPTGAVLLLDSLVMPHTPAV